MASWRVAVMQHVVSLDLSDNAVLGVVQGLLEGAAVLPLVASAACVICSGYSSAMRMSLLHRPCF